MVRVGGESVIGIDLSGLSRGTKGQTALAQVSIADPARALDQQVLPRGRRTDPELIAWVTERDPVVVGIDAPLSLPHSVTCEDRGCERCDPTSADYLARDVDALAGGMSTVMIAGIAFRGIYLARRLRARGVAVIEVYPAAAYRALGVLTKADRRDGALIASVLASLVQDAKLDTPDERDAIAAALVARSYAAGSAASFRGVDGEIWLPSPSPEAGS